uniref:60S ribosomal protein L18a n=1 Tax=Compsopogon caeruleus TaxID=31354 RepID=A0A7S1THG2_9RHOD|mmetsp:Transcript_4283/g.8423  ORF Transcript_4283/g.8423 Transcript_4283/m.8423 type:complete len:179 (+) Transcript_4283:110-646(+)|eukprot:CAMPEP_0184686426 /NCGR_PEP_ID=MMETSP0312-20130426/22408_1 /TAXON_ID=31354 /ORGANISM="Compsopogon coeruleus, Strain SAG 36.94" /LENGTH=178 /DNA_ID=CAMNT_0027141495 /DNA_START=77 /DNA_END=613 /DNA_ORIENTATION=-
MGWLHQYAVIGRKLPTEENPEPEVYRMKIFAPNEVVAKSRFWFFVSQLKNVKKASGEVISVNELFEKRAGVVRNYGIWLRYKSRSDEVNMYKEYRDVTMTGAVEQMYMEMSGRHRARWSSVQVLKVVVVDAKDCRRPQTLQFHENKLRFPMPHKLPRANFKRHRTTFKASRPSTAIME